MLAKIGLAFLGAVFTIMAQIFIKRWNVRSDTFRDRLHELTESVHALADAAGEYWAAPTSKNDFVHLEARLFALEHRVTALAGLLGEEQDEFRARTTDKLLDLKQACSGGNFQVRNRAPEPERYMRIQKEALELVSGLRRYERRLTQGLLW